jgi:antirestriction protein ArdC
VKTEQSENGFQRPSATHVAGYRQWQALGRYVKQGETGIGILAPLVYKRKQDDQPDGYRAGDDAELNGSGKELRGFRVVHVWDIEQTDGEPLIEFARVDGDPGEWLDRLERIVRDAGIELRYEDDLGGAQGLSSGGKVSVLANLPPADRFSILVHEYGHEMLHRGERRGETTKKIRETEAEAVAFVVARAIGLEARTHACDYIQLYRGDTDTLQESMHFIQRTAARIIEQLQEVDADLESSVAERKEVHHVA